MKTIFKYLLELTEEQTIDLPFNAHILSVQMQNGQLCLWAEVDTEQVKSKRTFMVFGTGHAIPDDIQLRTHRTHLATVQQGPLVWHVFEKWESQ